MTDSGGDHTQGSGVDYECVERIEGARATPVTLGKRDDDRRLLFCHPEGLKLFHRSELMLFGWMRVA
jgi:hypothetical protein